MKLIGAGLPRTGTLTQKLALEELGLGPCYHWVERDRRPRRRSRCGTARWTARPWDECSPASARRWTGPGATSTAS